MIGTNSSNTNALVVPTSLPWLNETFNHKGLVHIEVPMRLKHIGSYTQKYMTEVTLTNWMLYVMSMLNAVGSF